jgi:hypothetical protein
MENCPMRVSRTTILALTFVALLLGGCGSGSDDEQPIAPTARKSGNDAASGFTDPSKDPLAETPFAVSASALTVGTTVGPDGAVVKPPTARFTTADTVHVSFPVNGLAPGAPVTVFWTYQNGKTDHEERTRLAPNGKFASYSFSAANGMKPGSYNVEVQVNDRPVGIADFSVD